MFIDFCSCYQHSEEAAGPDRDWNAPKKGEHPGDRTKEEDDMFAQELQEAYVAMCALFECLVKTQVPWVIEHHRRSL